MIRPINNKLKFKTQKSKVPLNEFPTMIHIKIKLGFSRVNCPLFDRNQLSNHNLNNIFDFGSGKKHMLTNSDSRPITSGVNKNVVLAIALLVGSVGAFMTSALNVALPIINQEFKPNAILLNWVITSFILSWAVFSIPTGRLADIFGLRRFTIYGIIIFLVSTLAAVFSNSIAMLIILRAVQGIGAAILGGTVVAMISMTFPAKERGKALGIYISSVYAWLSVGPFLGGLLTEYLNWRSLFVFSLPFSLAILALLIWKVKAEWTGAKGEKFDFTGSMIFGLALVALMYGFSQIRQLMGILLTAGGLIGLFLFLVWENHVASPLINVRAFRNNRPFIFSNLASLITYSATSAITYLLSLFLQLIKGYSPFDASLILIVQPLVQTIIAPFTGRLSDKVQPRIVASIGMSLLCLGLASLILLTEDSSLVQIIATLVIIGVGFGVFVPPNTNAIMGAVAPKYYAVASSLTGTMRTIGQTLSMGITLILTALIIGNIAITRDYHPGFLTVVKVAFAIFAALCFAGIFASLARGKSQIQTDKGAPPTGH
jgi:EmrB/QacA subfamily drug resistance transporter